MSEHPPTAASPVAPSPVAADPTRAAGPSAETRPGVLLLLVRHGTTATTGTLLPGRAPGLHLAPAGQEQARQVAERLLERHAQHPLAALYASPLERTLETAQPTAERTGLPLRREDLLLECDVGEWTGSALADLARLEQWRTVQGDPARFTFPGGESFGDMQERMVAFAERVRRDHPGGTVVCFSHADPLRSLLSHALGGDLAAMQRLSVAPASISAVHYPEGGDPVVVLTNSSSSSSRSLADLTVQ